MTAAVRFRRQAQWGSDMQKILIVDQTKEVSAQIEEMMLWGRRSDFNLVNTVSDEKEMLERMTSEKIDIVLYVLHYQSVSEIEILKDMDERFREVAIILISSRSNYEAVREGFCAGAFDYLVPPLEEAILEESLNRTYESAGIHYIRNRLQFKIDALIEHLFTGGGREHEICMEILDQIYQEWEGDTIQCQMIADKAKAVIYEEIIRRKPWLEKFIYKKNYIHTVGMQFKSRKKVEQEWDSYFSDAGRMVKKYQMIDNKLVYPIGKYVVVHVDEKLTLENVAQGVFLNKSYVSHIFKKITNLYFMEYLLEVKIDRAKILLMDEEMKIYDAAGIVGFGNPDYFSRKFREKTGMSPTRYQSLVQSERKNLGC